MSYLVVPDITNGDIVCQDPCNHKDCQEMRLEWTNSQCVTCGKPMRPGQNYNYHLQLGESINQLGPSELNRRHIHSSCLYSTIIVDARKESHYGH